MAVKMEQFGKIFGKVFLAMQHWQHRREAIPATIVIGNVARCVAEFSKLFDHASRKTSRDTVMERWIA